jgi:ATP adenylyltransferase
VANCRFCEIMHEMNYQNGEIDKPFLENDSFAALASIGALVEGWSLIVPKQHQISMRNIYRDQEFKRFVNFVTPKLIEKYGSIIAFEHGSNKEGSITACGTDHAHLHLVPFKSLFSKMIESELIWKKCRVSELLPNVEKNEYLFYSELQNNKEWNDPIGYFTLLEKPVSQFFRHLIAEQVGLSEKYDYRKFPYEDVSRKTRNVLAGILS